MEYGLYTAYLGMRARQRTLDAIANNVANASTAGFKAERVLYRSIEAAGIEAQGAQSKPGATTIGGASPPAPVGTAGNQTATNRPPDGSVQASGQPESSTGVMTSGVTDFSVGSIRQTGRALDVALDGDGFLVVQTARGERYARAGALTLDASGQLVTTSGDLVVGEAGAITLPPGEVMIGEDGSISVQGQTVDRLKLVRFADPHTALGKEGASLFVATGTEQPSDSAETKVMQGALEMSNVNAVSEMVAMMQNGREFDSLQRSITMMMNDLGRKVSSEIGRL